MNLGIVVKNIRRGKSCVDERADLESIGFNYNSKSLRYGYKLVQVALLTCKDLNGDMLVPARFVVPTNDIIWPEETWDMKLGSVVNDIRGEKSHVHKRADLESIGFNFNLHKQSNVYELVRAAMLKYKGLKGNMLVPQKFVVPTDDISWPEETWGMKLGSVVDTIRRGKSYANKQADLESIGFNYDSKNKI
jgi:hypothetical protein